MNYKKPLNCEGERFWSNHFKVFAVLKFWFPPLVDFVEDKMHCVELAAIISGSYMINLNTNLLGIYSTFSMCEKYFPDGFDAPDALKITNKFSIYSHHFYFLVFLGNLKSSPFFITILSALFCIYDFILILVDTLYCGQTESIDTRGLFVYAYFRLSLSGMSVFYWLIVIILPKGYPNKLGFLHIIGNSITFLLSKLCRCSFFSNIYDIICCPFDYPIRIKAAGSIAFGLCLTNLLAIIFYTYRIYKIIDDLQDYLDYLRSQPYEDIFILIRLHREYIVSVEDGKKILKFLIELLVPIFPCVAVSISIGFLVSTASIVSLFYHFKRIVLQIRSEGSSSQVLKEVWKFKSYNSIFFCTQFIINAFFLGYIFSIALFIVCYVLSFKETMIYTWKFLTTRKIEFYLSFLPVILGYIYFPFLIKKNNFVRNKSYFSFWDTWYFLIGNFGALLKAMSRYFIGIGSILVLGFRVHISIMPYPFDQFDTLYVGFYASIVMQCMKDGIIPDDIAEEAGLNEPINRSLISFS